jgi:hypothetical protein
VAPFHRLEELHYYWMHPTKPPAAALSQTVYGASILTCL